MRRDLLAKNLKSIPASKTVDKEHFIENYTGSLYGNKRVLVSVVITGPETARLGWCHGRRIELGIEQAPVEQELSNSVFSGGPGS